MSSWHTGKGQGVLDSRYLRYKLDTRANILALSPATAMIAFSSDTNEYFIWNLTNWYVSSATFSIAVAAGGGGFQFNDAVNSGHFWFNF